MLSLTDGWAVGSEGTILHYDGTSWSEVSSPTSNDLYSVSMVSPTDGWTVGGTLEQSTILHYDGTFWSKVSSPTSNQLLSVTMLSPIDGWAVGWGNLFHYDGTSWSEVSSPTSESLYSVSMVSSTDGWAVGGGGTILHYDGTSWSEVSSPTLAGLNAVTMGPTGVWIVGDSGTILHNGIPVNSPTSEWLFSVAMTGPTDGWAVGSEGTILHYDGTNWTTVSSPTSNHLESITMTGPTDGWAVGPGGTILRFVGNTQPDTTPPTAFNLISPANNSQTGNTLPTFIWGASSDLESGIAGYELWIDGIKVKDVSGTSATPDQSLSLGEQYTWYVVARNGVGLTTTSTDSFTLMVGQFSDVPSDLTAAVVSSTQIDLSWQDNSDNEDNFKIERKTEGGTYSQIDTVPANITTYLDSDLSPGTIYCYRVKAYNSVADSDYSNTACATTPPTSTTLFVSLATEIVETGDIFTLDIELSNAHEFDSLETYLSFDPNILEVTNLAQGPFPQGATVIKKDYDNQNGKIDYAAGLLSDTATGSGTVLTIAFKAKGEGSSDICFDFDPQGLRETRILRSGISIPVTNTCGKVTVTDRGRVSGYVKFDLERIDHHLGIEVVVEGTGLKTETGENGYFAIEDVSPGTYQIATCAPGASPRSWENVTVSPGTETSLDTLTLLNADVDGECVEGNYMVDILDFIYNLAGELVNELSGTGRIWWDAKNKEGKEVSSGVYIYLVTDKDGQKTTGKITIIR